MIFSKEKFHTFPMGEVLDKVDGLSIVASSSSGRYQMWGVHETDEF